MANSNTKIIRKQQAQFIEDEVFTINTELENMTKKLNSVDRKKLLKLSSESLKYTRDRIQDLKRNIKLLNQRFEFIEKGEL